MKQSLLTVTRSLLLAALTCLSLRAVAGDTIQIVTEELPPYNMTEDGRLTGMSTEVVQAVLEEIGEPASIQSMPWAASNRLVMRCSTSHTKYAVSANATA
jgi:polar amino acid transport system substrate-binding protein